MIDTAELKKRFSSLTRYEQNILHRLCFRDAAMSYLDAQLWVADWVILDKISDTMRARKGWLPKEIMDNPQEPEPHSLLDYPKREALGYMRKYMKDGLSFPAYPSIKRVIDEFEKMGLVKSRKPIVGRGGKVFYVPEEYKKQIREWAAKLNENEMPFAR